MFYVAVDPVGGTGKIIKAVADGAAGVSKGFGDGIAAGAAGVASGAENGLRMGATEVGEAFATGFKEGGEAVTEILGSMSPCFACFFCASRLNALP